MLLLDRRRFNALIPAAALAASGAAFAQGKTLRILVGYAAGGAADTVARAVAEGLRDSGFNAIVENRPGAAGRLATDALLLAPADGNTLVMTPTGNLTLAPHIFKAARHDLLAQLSGVGTAARMSFAIAVAANSPAKTLQDYLAQAKADPHLATYGTPGAGTAMDFIGQMLSKDAKVALTGVPYKGGSAAVTDAIGGTLPAVITTLPNLLAMHRSGKLRLLATSDGETNPAVPGVPTFKSQGFPGLVVTETFAFFAKAGTAGAMVGELNRAITAAVKSPKVAAILQKAEYEPRSMAPDELNAMIKTEYTRWAEIVKATGYTAE